MRSAGKAGMGPGRLLAAGHAIAGDGGFDLNDPSVERRHHLAMNHRANERDDKNERIPHGGKRRATVRAGQERGTAT